MSYICKTVGNTSSTRKKPSKPKQVFMSAWLKISIFCQAIVEYFITWMKTFLVANTRLFLTWFYIHSDVLLSHNNQILINNLWHYKIEVIAFLMIYYYSLTDHTLCFLRVILLYLQSRSLNLDLLDFEAPNLLHTRIHTNTYAISSRHTLHLLTSSLLNRIMPLVRVKSIGHRDDIILKNLVDNFQGSPKIQALMVYLWRR